MRVGLPACSSRATLREAAQVMKRKRIPQIAVLGTGFQSAVVGIVTLEDILKAGDTETLDRDLLQTLFS